MKHFKNISLATDEQGSAAIETAIVFSFFLFFMMGVFELGMVKFGNSLIDDATSLAARSSMIGCLDDEYDETGACLESGYNGTETGRATVGVQEILDMLDTKSAGLVDVESQSFCFKTGQNRAGINDQSSEVDLGQGGVIMTYEISYKWPVFTPWLKVSSIFENVTNFKSVSMARNEYFPTTANRTDTISSGCDPCNSNSPQYNESYSDSCALRDACQANPTPACEAISNQCAGGRGNPELCAVWAGGATG